MPRPDLPWGAPLLHIPLNTPAFAGLNTQASSALLGPEWATRLENTVLDNSGRIAARKGWAERNDTSLGGQVTVLYEYYNASSQSWELIAVVDDDTIHRSTDLGSTWTDITGTATVSDHNLQFVELGGTLVGWQDGADPIQYSGTSFSDLSPASVPNGNVALSAFGRIWVKSSDTVVSYSNLLDETDWTGTGTGTIDLTSVWPLTDQITALAEFGGRLVIFGNRHIVIYDDSSGSDIGLDPANAVVTDLVSGIGCVARDSVQQVKGDLWFLDDSGLQSLSRIIATENNPLDNISKNVQDDLQTRVAAANPDNIKSVYSPRERFYLLCISLGTATNETGVVFCFDTDRPLDDGSYRVTGVWNTMIPQAIVYGDDRNLYISLKEKEGKVGRYFGYSDDGDNYVINYESGWSDLGSPNLKILKRMNALLYVQSETVVTFKWAFDFANEFRSAQATYPANAAAAQWGVSEWGEAEWGGGVRVREKRVGTSGTGEYIKLGITVNVAGELVSVQQLALYSKLGRLR